MFVLFVFSKMFTGSGRKMSNEVQLSQYSFKNQKIGTCKRKKMERKKAFFLGTTQYSVSF